MTDPLCTIGTAEGFKGGVHLALFALAMMCTGYNAMAWTQRKEAHLAVNAGVYGALAVFELRQIQRHLL